MKMDKKWKKENILKLSTWNVQGIAHKEEQLDDILAKKGISVAIISESKKKLQGTKETQNYIQFYSGVEQSCRAKAGVMMFISKKIKNTISDYTFWNERIIQVRLKLPRGYLSLIGVYAPIEGENEENDEFYLNLQNILNKVNQNDFIMIIGDFNARIGNSKIDTNIGIFGEQTRNNNGSRLIDFVSFNQLKVMNSFFNHKDSHKFTWEARGSKSIIDYAICNNKLADLVLDVRVFRGPEIESDHYLLICPIRLQPRWYKRKNKQAENQNIQSTYKVHLLNDSSIKWLYQKRLDELNETTTVSEDVEEEWQNISDLLKRAASQSLGTKRKWHRKKGLRNWDDNIKQIIENKREAYKQYICTKKEEDKINYHLKRAIAKREVRKYHRQNWDNFVSFLENDITRPQPQTYKILKLLNSETKDTARLNIISKETWLNYFTTLWHQNTPPLTLPQSDNHHRESITIEELMTVLKHMKSNKTPGEDGIHTELYKYATNTFHLRLLHFLNLIWAGQEPPHSWRKSIVIPIYKKGNRNACDNYRGISLLNTCYKIYSNIIKNKLYKYYEHILGEEQNGFRKGRSCCDGYFTMKILIEKHREFNIETHIAFVDFQKAFDKVNRNQLLNIMARDNIPAQIIQNVFNIYKETLISVKIGDKSSNQNMINSGVRQGCGLSPLLFNIYMDNIIREFRLTRHGFIPINRNLHLDTVIFADDLVLLATSEDDLQRSIYNLNLIAEKYSMEISTNKTKIMAFLGKDPVPSKICINGEILERVNEFKYLGYKLSFSIDSDVSEKIIKFNKSMGIINRIMKPSLVQKHTRIRLYKTLARPVLCYGSEAWTLHKHEESRIIANEMKFMRRTAGYTKWDRRRNEEILHELQITPVLDYIHQYQNQWLQHLNRMSRDRIPKAVFRYTPVGKRSLGRPMKRWQENFSRP